MNLMAVLARYGNVQPDVYADMDYLESIELGKRLIHMARKDEEVRMDFFLEIAKAIIKSNGMRVS